tara:strand:+ start:49 stop:369 length:321 start_codon:yes stop_codon:yes gene_type:complete
MSKPKIIYSKEFKEKCFNNLRFFMDIRLLMSAIDSGRDTIVRYYLEQALEDPELYVNEEITDDGERRIANAKIHAHAIRSEIYNEYMELLTLTIDKQNARKHRLLR